APRGTAHERGGRRTDPGASGARRGAPPWRGARPPSPADAVPVRAAGPRGRCRWPRRSARSCSCPIAGRMQSAFFVRRVLLPPPAPGPEVVARADRARARRASDARISQIVEPVVRYVVGADVRPHLIPAPVRQRIDLRDAAVVAVHLDLRDLGPPPG